MKTVYVLGVTAIAQLGLVVLTWWPSDTVPPGSSPTLSLDVEDLTEIHVSADAGETVLALRDEEWVVSSAGDYPAASDEVEDLLASLESLRQDPSPIATQAVSHHALGVHEDAFDRQIRLQAGDAEQTLFVGRGGTATLHVRDSESDAVFEARGARLVDFSGSASAYVDTTWVDLEEDDLTELRIEQSGNVLALTRADDTWTVEGVPAGREIDSAAADRLVRAATSVRMSEPADVSIGAVHAAVTLHWSTDENSGRYVLANESDGKRLAYIDGNEHVVWVSASSVRSIVDASLNALLIPLEDPAEPGA